MIETAAAATVVGNVALITRLNWQSANGSKMLDYELVSTILLCFGVCACLDRMLVRAAFPPNSPVMAILADFVVPLLDGLFALLLVMLPAFCLQATRNSLMQL